MMNTILAKADKAAVEKAAALLRAGQIVAIPTETVYGIAASALNGAAVKKIFGLGSCFLGIIEENSFQR